MNYNDICARIDYLKDKESWNRYDIELLANLCRVRDELDDDYYYFQEQDEDIEAGKVSESGDMPITTEQRRVVRNAYSGAHDGEHIELTPEMARKWAESMQNADGTKGAHWNISQTDQVRGNLDYDPTCYWITMNMMYSDYCNVARKLNINTVDFYAGMTQAFLDDIDAISPKEKLGAYYTYIVKK